MSICKHVDIQEKKIFIKYVQLWIWSPAFIMLFFFSLVVIKITHYFWMSPNFLIPQMAILLCAIFREIIYKIWWKWSSAGIQYKTERIIENEYFLPVRLSRRTKMTFESKKNIFMNQIQLFDDVVLLEWVTSFVIFW